MFSTKTAVFDSSNKYMNAGINDNVTLKEVNVLKSPNGRDYLEIIFEDANGAIASLTEWKNEKNMWIKTDEDLQNRDNIQFGRILQLINSFTTAPDVELKSFTDMINWVKQMLDPMIATKKKLRLKVSYDKKGYTRVSQYGIFVEDMSITDSQIKLFKSDLMEKPVVADKENDDPLNVPPAVTPDSVNEGSGASDLPF